MGIFDDTEVVTTTAYVASTALIDRKDFYNTRGQFILSAIRHNKEDVAENIIASNLAGFSMRVRRFTFYGINYYPFPPPTGDIVYDTSSSPELANIIKTLYGDTAVVESNEIGNFNDYFYVVKYLSSYFTDSSGNSWSSTEPTYTIRTVDGKLVQINNTPYLVRNFIYGQLYLEIRFPSTVSSFIPAVYSRAYEPAYYNEAGTATEGTFYHTIVGFTDDPTKREYWIYRADTLEYPSLILLPTSINDTFLPVAILMRDKVWFDDMEDDIPLHTDRLLSKINLDPYAIKEQIQLQNDEEDVEKYDVCINFACPTDQMGKIIYNPGGLDESEAEYGYHFCKNHENSGAWITWRDWALETGAYLAEQDPDEVEIPRTAQPTKEGIVVKIGGSFGYVAIHEWNFIIREVRTSLDGTVPFFDFGFSYYYSQIPEGESFYYPPIPSGITIIRQISPYQYEAYYIGGLDLKFVINTSQGYRVAYQGPFLPVHSGLLANLNSVQQERILQASLRATMFLVKEEVEKIKWYQKGLFKVLFVAIAIILVVITWQGWLAGWVVATFGGTLSVVTVVLKLIASLVVSLISNFVLSGQEALIFSMVMGFFMAGGVQGIAASAQSALDNIKNLSISFNNAISYLKAASTIYLKRESFKIAEAYKDLETEQREWIQSAKEREEELEDLWYGLDPPDNLTPATILRSSNAMVYAEPPDRMYNRISEKNPGVKCFELINRFFDICLQLPDEPTDSNPLLALNDIKVGDS